MGNDGRSWTSLISFYALAILMAAIGPAPLPESSVANVADVGPRSLVEPAAAPSLVDSR